MTKLRKVVTDRMWNYLFRALVAVPAGVAQQSVCEWTAYPAQAVYQKKKR
jgi:hypothetical protein